MVRGLRTPLTPRSAMFTSTLPRIGCNTASFTCSSPSIVRRIRLRRAAREGHHTHSEQLPPPPNQGLAVSEPHGTNQQRQSVHNAWSSWPGGPRDPQKPWRRAKTSALTRSHACAEEAGIDLRTPLDQWSGREDEAHRQGRDRETLPLRSRVASAPPRRFRCRTQFRPSTEDAQEAHRRPRGAGPGSQSRKPGRPLSQSASCSLF